MEKKMKIYNIKAEKTYSMVYEIEAETEEEAIKKVKTECCVDKEEECDGPYYQIFEVKTYPAEVCDE